jgi:anti-sigma regulatory factor (Ser/Thr protein kinase)
MVRAARSLTCGTSRSASTSTSTGTGTAEDAADGRTGTPARRSRLPLRTASGSSTARRFTERCLERWGLSESALGDDAVLVVSELVTNALIHGELAEELRLSWHPPSLTIEVRDTGPGLPRLHHPDTTDSGHRGLEIVATLAASWAVIPGPACTKTVRAVLQGE